MLGEEQRAAKQLQRNTAHLQKATVCACVRLSLVQTCKQQWGHTPNS